MQDGLGERTGDERNGRFGQECTSLVLRGNLFAFCVDRLQSDEETEFVFGALIYDLEFWLVSLTWSASLSGSPSGPSSLNFGAGWSKLNLALLSRVDW